MIQKPPEIQAKTNFIKKPPLKVEKGFVQHKLHIPEKSKIGVGVSHFISEGIRSQFFRNVRSRSGFGSLALLLQFTMQLGYRDEYKSETESRTFFRVRFRHGVNFLEHFEFRVAKLLLHHLLLSCKYQFTEAN